MASNIIIWTKFLIATPLGPIGLGWPTQIEGGQISWLLASELPFSIFFGFFWLGCLEILVLAMPESMEAIAVKKSPKMPLWNFLTFFSLFFQMAVDRVKMIFQTPNKGLTCFKHYKFLIFDEKKLPKNFCTTYFKISLVPYS